MFGALPTEQHRYDGLPALSPERLHERRELVFLLLAGLFLGTLAMLNIIGVTRFIDLSFTMPLIDRKIPMPVAVGVLPYPITFLCTDFICELYGKRRANAVVMVGLLLNLWVIFILWLGGALPGVANPAHPGAYSHLQRAAFGAVSASMIAYVLAQFVDVHLFHFWKKLTRGKYLWLRNNGSTMVSQMVDTVAVILITHYAAHLLPMRAGESVASQLLEYIAAGYTFKFVMAALDTIPFYIGVKQMSRYLRLTPATEAASERIHKHT